MPWDVAPRELGGSDWEGNGVVREIEKGIGNWQAVLDVSAEFSFRVRTPLAEEVVEALSALDVIT